MKDKIIELLKQYEDTHTQGVYRCDYDELADEVVKLFCQPAVNERSEQLKCEHKGRRTATELVEYCEDCKKILFHP